MVVAKGAEAEARRNRHLGLTHQQLGELHRAHVPEGFGNLGPDKHGGLGRRHFPADAVKAFDEHIPALAVNIGDFRHAFLRPVKGHGCSNLDGLEHAVVQIALDSGQRVDHFAVARAEAHAPAGHGIAFGHGEEFHAHIFGAFGLQEAGGHIAVKHQVRVGQVVNDPDFVFFGEIHHFLEKFQAGHLTRGVVRVVDDEQLGVRPGLLHGAGQILEKVAAPAKGYAANVGPGNDGRGGVDGIGRVRGENHVAGLEHGKGQVGQTLFGAHGDNGFAIRVDVYVKAAGVPVADGFAQVGNAA